jgi:hypothetical protein
MENKGVSMQTQNAYNQKSGEQFERLTVSPWQLVAGIDAGGAGHPVYCGECGGLLHD